MRNRTNSGSPAVARTPQSNSSESSDEMDLEPILRGHIKCLQTSINTLKNPIGNIGKDLLPNEVKIDNVGLLQLKLKEPENKNESFIPTTSNNKNAQEPKNRDLDLTPKPLREVRALPIPERGRGPTEEPIHKKAIRKLTSLRTPNTTVRVGTRNNQSSNDPSRTSKMLFSFLLYTSMLYIIPFSIEYATHLSRQVVAFRILLRIISYIGTILPLAFKFVCFCSIHLVSYYIPSVKYLLYLYYNE